MPEVEEVKDELTEVVESAETEASAGDETAETSEAKVASTDEIKKAKEHEGGFQKRIRKLSERISAKEAEAEYWREQALRTAKSEPKVEAKVEDDPEPDPEKFETTAEYLKATRAWDKRQIKKEMTAEAEKLYESKVKATEEKTAQRTQAEKWAVAESAALDKHGDYADVSDGCIALLKTHASPALNSVASAIQASEVGPEMLYYLGNHPEEIKQLSKLNPFAAVMKLGQIEANLANQEPDEQEEDAEEGEIPDEVPKPASMPAAPIAPVKKTAKTAGHDVYDEKTDIAAWVKMRNKQVEEAAKRR